MKWWTHIAAFLLGVTVVWAFMLGSESSDDIQQGLSKPAKMKTASVEVASGTDCEEKLDLVRRSHEEAVERWADNEEMVEHLEDLLQRVSPERPMEFPDALDEPFHPDQFGERVAELMDSCPEMFPSGTTVDCSEYPCAIRTPAGSSPDDFDPRADWRDECPAFREQFEGSGATRYFAEIGDERWTQYLVTGSGEGLWGYLQEEEVRSRMAARGTRRWDAFREERARELFEEACVTERDGAACNELAAATVGAQRERYLEGGCEAGFAHACHNLARYLCEHLGRCDGAALESAELAIALDSSVPGFHRTLGVVLCAQGHSGLAAGAFRDACDLGDDGACERSC